MNTYLPTTRSEAGGIGLGITSGLVIGFVFFRISQRYISQWIPMPLLMGIAIAGLTGCILAGLFMQWPGRSKPQTTAKLTAWLQRGLLYMLALDLSLFGWQKIMKLQMIVPLGMLDTPFSSFSGENLLWAFYRWSYPFTVCIGLLQLACGYGLLVARTRFLALLAIVPMLVNIIGLDYFYKMPVWVLLHAVVLLLGTFYLLSLERERLQALLLAPFSGLGTLTISTSVRLVVKLSVFGWALLFFTTYSYPDKQPELTGKYQVSKLTVNNQPVGVTSPKDSVLSHVYFDLENEIALDFNDYRYRYIGTYQYVPSSHSINVRWRYPSNTITPFVGTLIKDQSGLRMEGSLAGQRLMMNLQKTE